MIIYERITMKTVILLLLAMTIPFPLCLFRMKKYGISLSKMLIIYLVVSGIGFIGARFGPTVVGIENAGIRLYGLVLFDFIAIFPMSRIMKIDISKYADFIAPPIMAVCASSKISCWLNGCCRGFVMYYDEGEVVRFPSVITEMAIWAIFVVLLLIIEKKCVEGSLWPILMIWFGFVRFAVDFLRGSETERIPYFAFLSGGQFWSLVTMFIGIICLYIVLKNKLERSPSVVELLKTTFGFHPVKQLN